VSLQLKIRRKPQAGQMSERLQRAREATQTGAARAAERIGPAAQQARDVSSRRITDARAWTAPRLERTAKYVEQELGPRVGSVIHTTAHKVKPARPRRRRRIIALTLLVVGSVAGTLGALARRRNATPSSSEDEDKAAADAAMSDNGQVRTP
jgi:hypothetical protein